jgi:hypothetical protein
MANNCEDCFDRSVEIPVGPTGANGSTGAQGPAGTNGTNGTNGTQVIINSTTVGKYTASTYTNLLTGTIPANTLVAVGDVLRIEFSAHGALYNNGATYEFKLTLGGVDIPYTYTTDSDSTINKNAIHGTVDLIVTNLSPFTLRVYLKEAEKMVGITIGNMTLFTTPSNGTLRYNGVDFASDMSGLVVPTVSNTLAFVGKNSTGSALNPFGAKRLLVTLLKKS